jgi:hypothetical protein
LNNGTDKFTGAEIAAVVESFDAGEELSDMSLLRAPHATVPLASALESPPVLTRALG